MQKGLIDSKFV